MRPTTAVRREFVVLSNRSESSASPHLQEGVILMISLRSLVAVAVPTALMITSVGCSTLGRGKCKSGDSYPAAASCQDCQNGGNYSAPLYSPNPIPVPPASVPPAELPTVPVPPPPGGAAARPSMMQRMQGSTTACFLNANESVRSTFRR